MIANTYVVKPFGISEVKVIALKGEPGGPTQEQVNAAVEEYMDDHPEAQIPDGAVTTEKLASNTVAPYADNLVSSSYVSDSEPYLFRKTFAGVREDTEIVGGSVVFNQLCNAASVTVANGHKYFMKKGTAYSLGASTGTAITGLTSGSDMVIDLTLMFGSTVADYIYSLEIATAGAGVAFFRSLFDKPYYAYNAGTLMSVNTSAHKMVGKNLLEPLSYSDGVNVSAYRVFRVSLPKDARLCMSFKDKDTSVDVSSVSVGFVSPNYTSGALSSDQYRWIIANGVVRAEKRNIPISGDDSIYLNAILFYPRTQEAFDAVMARYDIQVEFGSTATLYEPYTTITYPLDSSLTLRGIPKLVDNQLVYDGDVYKADGTVERRYGYRAYQSGDESLANAITDGTHTVYKLTTATTETTDPFTNPQVCYPDGTEEYIDTRDVPIPVGHNTKYMRDLKKLLEGIPDAPTTNGTYVLKATVSSSGVTYSWVEG